MDYTALSSGRTEKESAAHLRELGNGIQTLIACPAVMFERKTEERRDAGQSVAAEQADQQQDGVHDHGKKRGSGSSKEERKK
jgi:hypothetical protein